MTGTMSKALEAAADMIASFDRIKDDPMETLRAIFAHLAEDEAVVERVKRTLQIEAGEDWVYQAKAILRTLAGKE